MLRAFVKARKLLENFCGVTFNLTEIKQSLFNVVERVPFLSSPGLNGGQVGDQHVSGVFLMLWWNPLTVVACASALCFFRQFEMDETIFHLSSRNVWVDISSVISEFYHHHVPWLNRLLFVCLTLPRGVSSDMCSRLWYVQTHLIYKCRSTLKCETWLLPYI